MDIVLIALGLVALLGGGELLVRGALGLSVRFGMAPAVAGVVVMGFGTSSPELAASLAAAFADAPGIALGNVIGSNIANIALILGVVALIAPLAVRIGRRDGIALVAATAYLLFVLAIGGIGRGVALVGLAGLGVYLWLILREEPGEAADTVLGIRGRRAALYSAAGLLLLIGGARALVTGSLGIAEALGVPPSITGLTIVAVGTSLPELSASLVAAWRGQGGLAIGNILGSNVFNALGIVGVTALVHPLQVPPSIDWGEGAALVISAAALLGLAALGRAGRLAGAGLIGGYAVYIVTLV
ncbi:sodium:calcium antiporter [Rhodobacterales bacterium HKCCE4037]|nr:sodium:calcium antiporter [Rhodobacterales bacterium HKCCE4037]